MEYSAASDDPAPTENPEGEEPAEKQPAPVADTEKRIKLDIQQPATLDTILEELSKKADLQVVSDCFYREHLTFFTNFEGDLQSFIRQLAHKAKVSTTRSGKALAVVDDKWYMKRAWAVPDDWMDYWREQVKKGRLGLDDIAQIASLTDDQIAKSIYRDAQLRNRVRGPMKNREVLQFYNALAGGQKNSLTSETGLDPASLRQNQTPYFNRIYSRTLPGRMLTAVQPKDVKMMTMRLVVDDRSGSHTFRLVDRTPDPLTGNRESELASWSALLYPGPQM
jgi:hypothetical protein